MKDLSEINNINTSKPFRKFLEFEQYVDEDSDAIVNIGSSNIKGNYNHLGDNDDKISDNDDKSIEDSI